MMKDNSSEAMKSDVNAVAIWEAKFKKDTLGGRDFREYWKLHVPTIYAPDESTNFLHITYDDDSAQKLLFDTLKQFICIDNPAEVLKHLKELTTPAALCGKVFRMGEATYSCRDCGQDGTCVLCRDCFKASAHQQHRYKMNQSVGGGYCDCGDREAWKDSFCCSIHERNAAGSGTSSLLKFPPEIVQRARAVFSAVLDYALEMLTHENTMGLPHDLRSPLEQEGDADDLLSGTEPFRTPLYVTMFYNDETHTFEQVIECLRRAVECSQRDAVDYATIIDRVGRSIVKCGDFQTCNRAKQVFELHSSRHSIGPYKVHVMHTHVVAHQTFAMRLLLWLKKLIEEVDGFRTLFGQLVTDPAADGPVLERVMKSDTQLWKLARNQWHLLLIQGMLMENDSKKVFAKTFTRLYPTLMRDFMWDDHNHSDSVTSLSVQIYTVPTIAHMLITNEDCLFVVTRTFYDECVNRRNAQGVLSFDARHQNTTWRRINYCLNDLRYLLSVKPPQWTDQLRKGFLHGFAALLDVLAVMEGMDSSVRQMGNHLEYDPEWQTAFTLFGKLSIVIYHLIDWCSSDRMVLVKAYRAVLRKLYGKLSEERLNPSATVEAAGKKFSVVEFDMWQKPVSLHLPLTRMLAGLHLHLGRFGLTFNASEFEMEDRPTIQQIMETSLRAVILTTQVRAGMWRRNGTSLVSQVHFYSNVRIRSEIQDRDIQILQMTAALEDPDEFIMTLMLRYGIHHWLAPNFESVMRRTSEVDGEPVTYFVQTVQEGGKTVTNFVQTVQEFTHNLEELMLVLIHVFGERYQPGVGAVTREDCLKKEIIQSLCIEPTPHSKLCKLVVAENQDVSIEQLADQVAEFKLPQHGTGKGVYELKPELYSDYNPFWYHYTREEQSRAEGAQRRRKRLAGEPACLPPPQLPLFTPEFRAARNIAVCPAMLDVLLTVLRRSADLRARVFSETLFQRTLFLIGLALNEEGRAAATAGAGADSPQQQQPAFCFSRPAQQSGIVDALQSMVGNPRVSSHADLLSWVVSQLNRLLGLSTATPDSSAAAAEDAGSEQKRRRAQAAARRARILGQMQAQQKKFITQNVTALAEPEEAEADRAAADGALTAGRARPLTGSAMDLSECAGADEWPVCLGPRQSARPAAPAEYTCILCQASEQVSSTRPAMVMAAFVQLSTVLSRDRSSSATNPLLYVPSSLHRLPHTSSCGHAMHAACWQKHFENVCQRQMRRAHRLRHNMSSYDVQKREFLCPLCQCLSNTVVPLVPARMVALDGDDRPPVDNINVWIKGLQLACAHTVVKVDEAPANSTEPSRVHYRSPGLKAVLKHMTQREANQFRAQVRLGDRISEIPTSTREMMNTFAMVPCMVGLDGRVEFGDRRVPLLSLQTCAYTLHTTEQLLRHTGRPLLAELGSRGDICLTQLTHVCATMLPVVTELETAQESCLGLLRLLLDQPADGPAVTDMDAFGLVVMLCALTTALFAEHADNIPAPSGSLQELQCVRLSLLLHLVQILLTMDVAELTRLQPMETDGETAAADQDEQQWLAELYTLVRSAAGVEVADVSPPLLRQYVISAVTPFLRCCALYFHFLTGVRAPSELLQPLPLPEQYPHLLRYLGLDSLCVPQVTDCHSVLQDLIAKWCQHPGIRPYLSGSRGPTVKYPLSVNTLVPLPVDFSELINKVSDFTCPSSDGESRVPAMCLACGELLCSQSYCCQVQVDLGQIIGQIGACNAHLMRCGAGSGVMLRIRECRVHLLVNKVRGASVPPPYVDKFGEMDQGLQRGNPLTLWREQYDKLNRLWIAHGIPEEVTRHMEDSFSQTDWQNL